jgi:hypothetical protein
MIKLSPFTLFYRARTEDEGGYVGGSSYSTPSIEQPAAESNKTSDKGPGSSAGKRSGTKSTSKSKARGASVTKKGGEGLHPHFEVIRKAAPELFGPLKSLNPNLSNTLLDSSLAQAEASEDPTQAAIERLRPVVEDLRRGSETVTVAIWDLDARVGLLPNIIDTLNEAQEVFTFFDLQAPIPAGLVIRSEHFASWARLRANKSHVSKAEKSEFDDNLMSNDFYKYARVVYKNLGVDYLAGITQYKVAGLESGEYYWNYFSASQRHIILASAFDLREYAREAERPFEAAVAQVVLAQLLVEIGPKARFHDDASCIFDFNESRGSIVRSLKEMRIESQCLEKIDGRYRDAAEKMIGALRNYSRSPEFVKAAQDEQEKKSSSKHDDTYWLKQLNILSAKLGKEQKS